MALPHAARLICSGALLALGVVGLSCESEAPEVAIVPAATTSPEGCAPALNPVKLVQLPDRVPAGAQASSSAVSLARSEIVRPPARLVLDHRLNATDEAGRLHPGIIEGEVVLATPDARIDHIDLTLLTFQQTRSMFLVHHLAKVRMRAPGRFRVRHLPKGEWWVAVEAVRGSKVAWARSDKLILDDGTPKRDVVLHPVAYGIEATVKGVPPRLRGQVQVSAEVLWSDEIAATTLGEGLLNSTAQDDPDGHLGTLRYSFFGGRDSQTERLVFDPAQTSKQRFTDFGDSEQVETPDRDGQVSFWAPGPSTATVRLLAVPGAWDEMTREVSIDPERPRVHVEFEVAQE